MTKIIGFTGSHATGKSTLLEELRRAFAKSDEVIVDTFSVPRASQAQLYPGMALADIVSNLDRVTALQNLVVNKKSEHLARLAAENPHAQYILTDRSPIDFIAYTWLWLAQTHAHTDLSHATQLWLNAYVQECLIDVQQGYHAVVYFPANRFAFVSEDNRGSAESQTHHDALITKALAMLEKTEVVTLDSLSVAERLVEVCYKLGLSS